MKKLTLLALSLFACSMASAMITFDATIKTDNEEVVLTPALLSLENNTATYTINGVEYKVVLKNYIKSSDEEGVVGVTVDLSSTRDGVETVFASQMLTITDSAATVTFGSVEGFVRITVQNATETE